MARNRIEPEDDDDQFALSRVNGPAISLIIVSGFSIAILLIGLGLEVFLLSVERPERWPGQKESEQQGAIVRTVWSFLLIGSNVLTLVGAVKMKQLKNETAARNACIAAMIPCLGPCCLLGIPFGIWGYKTLKDPVVQRAFYRREHQYR